MPEAIRRRPNARTQARLLDEQRYSCLYCTFPFGTLVRRRTRDELTRLEWDHFVPYALAGRNSEDNWVAACHICNGLKSDHVFEDTAEARDAILVRWVETKALVLWIPTVSSEEDADAWAAERALQTPRTPSNREEPPSTSSTPARQKRRRGFATCQGCGEDYKVMTGRQVACSEMCVSVIRQRQGRAGV